MSEPKDKPVDISADEMRKIQDRVRRELAIEAGDHGQAIIPAQVKFADKQTKPADTHAQDPNNQKGRPGRTNEL